MTQEEKQLLLVDLCGRLPYGVKIELTNNGYHHENIAKRGDKTVDTLKGFTDNYFTIHHNNSLDWYWACSEIDIEDIKPYLFPLSSMSKKQCYELSSIRSSFQDCWKYIKTPIPLSICNFKQIEWFHKNHFDYRGLIEKGLAIGATGLNIY